MIQSIGVDIVDNNRIKEQINNNAFIKRILSAKEYEVFESFSLEKRKIEYLAGRFASKEAIFKAIKVAEKTINYKDISILNDENQAPYVEFDYLKDKKIHISISHETNMTIAFVIIE
ncbi:MAG TPA: holo-ACP synthase [Bacilli bacterium]|nr:holo-ACP synthase [Bacilli bacterium]